MADTHPAPGAVAVPPATTAERQARSFVDAIAARWDLVLRLGLLAIIIFLAIFFAVRTAPSPLEIGASTFLSVDNLQNIGRQMAVIGVIAVGETFVIVTAGIDLSVGSVVGITALTASIELANGYPLPVALITPILLALFIGLINGLLIDTQKLPPFIVTLGMLGILRGITNIKANGVDLPFDQVGFTNFGINTTFGIPNLFIVLVLVSIVSAIVLQYSSLGRHIYALGSNYDGARLAGINVRRTTIVVYAISACLAGVAGVLLTSRLGLGDPQSGTGYELEAISAAVLGGASLFGARGSIVGTFMGVLLVNMMDNGINLLGVDSFYATVIEGVLLIAVVWVDQWRKRKLAL